MANVFIYGGLSILLLGSAFGFFVALKGYRETRANMPRKVSYWGFSQGPKSPEMKRLIRIWSIVMVVGLILTGIGLAIGLN